MNLEQKQARIRELEREGLSAFRAGDHESAERVKAEIRRVKRVKTPDEPPPPLEEAWHQWLIAIGNVLTKGAKLTERTESEGRVRSVPTDS